MEYNQPFQQTNSGLLCPLITVWLIFVLDLSSFWKGSLGLFPVSFQLVIAILVTYGIKNRNFKYYKVGLIISLIQSIIGTLLLLYILALYSNVKMKSGEWAALFIYMIILSIFIWLQSGILLIFRKKVESQCNYNMSGFYYPAV